MKAGLESSQAGTSPLLMESTLTLAILLASEHYLLVLTSRCEGFRAK